MCLMQDRLRIEMHCMRRSRWCQTQQINFVVVVVVVVIVAFDLTVTLQMS